MPDFTAYAIHAGSVALIGVIVALIGWAHPRTGWPLQFGGTVVALLSGGTALFLAVAPIALDLTA